MNDLPEHISIWGELADTDHELCHVDVNGVRTRVLRAGSGPDLVLLHGTGGHLEAYARDIAGLARDFRVTAYDMVGHGWSDLPDRPYTTDVLSDHLHICRGSRSAAGSPPGPRPTTRTGSTGSYSIRRATSPTSPR
jgi:2-hydroxy-6-oxonona-2,4-dienedioate hydrolase